MHKKKGNNTPIQKAKEAKVKQANFSQQKDNPLTQEWIDKLKHQLQILKKILFQWSIKSGSMAYYNKKDIAIIKEYLAHHHEYYQYDQFDTSFQLIPLNNINFDHIVSQTIIFKSFNLFNRAKWPIRFHTKFISKLNDYSTNELYYVLGFVYYLANGNFVSKSSGGANNYGLARPLQIKSIPFNRFFVVKIFKQKNMFVHIGIQKIPVIKQGIIKRYEYQNYMQFLDILGDMYVQNKNKCDQRMRVFTQYIFNDVAKKDHSQQIQIDSTLYSKTNRYFYYQVFNQYSEKVQYYDSTLPDQSSITNSPSDRILPLAIKPYYVSSSQGSTMMFDGKIKRWISKDHLNFLERKKIAEYQKQISDQLIKRFVDFQSAKTLVQLLTKIPNFKVNLTEQEKDVIGQNGNVLAIGRSGTGKTTCAVLRLFSIEMLFKIRVSLYRKKFSQTVKDVRCDSNDIQQVFGLHCIFLTASPVLTHQIQRYYKKLTDNIKAQLQKKKKKIAEQRKKKAQQEKLSEEKIVEEVSFQDLNQSSKMEDQDGQKKAQILQISKQEQHANENSQIVPQLLQKTQSNKSAQEMQQQNLINEQFKDLDLKQDINNENFDEKEEDIDELKNKFEQNIKKYSSLFDLQQKDYPGFFTVKSFIMMIDGVLAKPFFIRRKNQIVNQDSNASWHNQRKGVMMIQNYYKHEQQQTNMNIDQIQEEINYSDQQELQHQYLRQIQLRQNKDKQNLTKKLQKNKSSNVLSFQVDYQYFIVHFWPKVVKKYYSSRNITAHLVWTQIYSTIKGSATAHQYPGQYLTQTAYMSCTANTFLTRQQKLDIYQTFCQYQRWKIRAGGYDIIDAVNYILNYLRFRPYEGPQIHYVMIDQVQDLPHAIVYLLSKMATYGVFYSGDTAQTIAKGVGFRFCDLKSLFNPQLFDYSIILKAPIIKHLTINFRSHNNILQLANSIVSSIQILFPKTIDRMKKQISDLHGPKPMILSSSDQELLFYVLCGGQQKAPEQGQNAIKKSPLQFGCDQVIIVRDQESKQKVPTMLQHALCLTIYEAKGLEFNDVILFNFFTQSPCQQKWSLLKTLDIVTQQVSKQDYENNLSRHKVQQDKINQPQKNQQLQKKAEMTEEQFEQVPVDEKFNKESNSYQIKKIVQSKKNMNKDINDFAQLCSQLKLLYTAVTRPRKTLIIYDDKQTPSRSTLQRIWQKLDVIEIITKQLVMESNKKVTQTEEIKIFKKIINSTNSDQWKQQGLRMYARGYFDQAMKCFDRSGNKELYKKAEANKHADQSTKKLIEIESERNAIKQGAYTYKNMNSSEVSKIKRKLKQQQVRAINNFKYAGSVFQEMLMFKQAGQCYFSGKIFQKAYQCFCKAFMNKQAAESLQMQNKYREAAQYYEKDDNYLKVIECLDLLNQWTLILQKIHKFADKMSDYEKQALLKKYSALALQQLVYQIQFENQEEGSKPQNNRVQVIEEKQSDEQEYDSDEDPQLAAQREYERKISEQMSGSNPSRKQSQVSQEQLIQIKSSVSQVQDSQSKSEAVQANVIKQSLNNEEVSASFSQLNESKTQVPQKQAVLQVVQSSFSDLNDSVRQVVGVKEQNKSQQVDIVSINSSFSDLNDKYQNQLEPDIQSIRSLVDPDDIWVKNSISEIGNKLHSEYSVIDDQEENYNLNVKIIKTKGNIFVQDQIMQKIVNIVSIINSSVQQFFKQFKGYQSLITLNKKQDGETVIDNRPQISQFQDIDSKFINIILDTLQSFKLFKLCLFVCNRYHLPSKAGRYLLSLGLKYSTNCISNNSVNPILLAPSNFRKTEIQKGILASIGLHAIYQNVNADFLKIKVTDHEQQNKKSLGIYFIEGLILQGLYKKAVFMVNPQQSLKILENFNDFQAYNSIYHQKILKKQLNTETLQFSSKLSKSQQQISYTRMLLKKVLFEVSVVNRFQSVSLRYYRQFASSQPDISKISQYKIPEYLPFTKILVENAKQLTAQFKIYIPKLFDILQNGDSLQVLDCIGTFLIILYNENYQHQLLGQLNNDQFLQVYRSVKHIQLALKKFTGKNAINIIQAVFFMHQCYRINHCKTMSYLNDVYCFVHRTSTVANDLVENVKTNAGQFAFFFEQDYNLILAKSSKVSKIILKKYQNALIRLFTQRKNMKKYHIKFLPSDFVAQEEQELIRKALKLQVELLLDPKSVKKQISDGPQRKKTKQLKPSFDFRNNSGKQFYIINLKDESSSEEDVQQQIRQQSKFYRPNFNTKLKYMAPLLINMFLQHSKNSKQTVEGQQLYSGGINNYYRQYTARRGGFNLFDAIEFKKFYRIDLYAENILSVIDNLTLFAKHNYLVQNLTLLMLHYRALQSPEGFSIEVTNNELKYFDNLQFVGIKIKEQVGCKLTNQEINHLLTNHKQCIFSYNNKYVSEMDINEIANLICDYLEILKDEQASQHVNFSTLILSYVINISSSDQINQSLRKIINLYCKYWKFESLSLITDSKNLLEYKDKRKQLLEASYKSINEQLHTIQVNNIGNLKRSIEESEFDYEVQGKIIQGKKKAATKIIRWWKAKRAELKEKKKEGNYFQLAVKPTNLNHAKKPDTIKDIRLMQIIYPKRNILQELNFLVQTEQAKEELLSFLLTNTINSSLDFHFILMTLNKIEECRQQYFQFCTWDPQQIHELNFEEVKVEVNQLTQTIEIWKRDEKWMREKNINIKRKKVFEVKWMTKNIGLSGLLKKRAGLKKQQILQKKKNFIKRMK